MGRVRSFVGERLWMRFCARLTPLIASGSRSFIGNVVNDWNPLIAREQSVSLSFLFVLVGQDCFVRVVCKMGARTRCTYGSVVREAI